MPRFNKLLVLDLDETLVHATEKKLEREPDFQVFDFFIYKRPGLDIFLEQCLEMFEVAVWTSSGGDYANQVVNFIFKEREKLKILLTSSHCIRRFDHDLGYHYTVKDLRKMKKKTGFSLESIIMVDDSKEKLERNYGNVILVNEFTGQEGDEELSKLLKYLEVVGGAENVRQIDKLHWSKKY